MLSNEELAGYLSVGSEARAVEYKGAIDVETADYIAKVARAALAMTNQRDGGYIILGVTDNNVLDSTNGLDASQLENWSRHDWVTDKINRFADPPLNLEVAVRQHPNGRPLVVIRVHEFAEIPSVCARDSANNILKIGQLYTRSIRKPESTSYHTQNEVRELLDLATTKGLQRFLEMARSAGISSGQQEERDEALYQRQVDFVYSLEASRTILEVPHFQHHIYPERFEDDRIGYGALEPVAREAAVLMRGWPFPSVHNPLRNEGCIHESSDFGRTHENWALFTSGLFVDLRQIGQWPSDGDSFGDDEDPNIQGNMPVWFGLLHFTEALNFAARIRAKVGNPEPTIVRFRGRNLAGQRLVVANNLRSGFHQNYIYHGSSWTSAEYKITDGTTPVELRDYAIDAALSLIQLFGWAGATPTLLRGIQESTFDGA